MTAQDSTAVQGLLSLLSEDDNSLKAYALAQLDMISSHAWPEIAESIIEIERLHEDTKFPQRNLAALLASKLLFHLGEIKQSLNFALEAGDLFDVFSKSEYVDTLIAKCVELYITSRTDKKTEMSEPLDARIDSIIGKMFSRCFEEKKFKQAIGIAVESRRLDIIENCINTAASQDRPSLLDYTYTLCFTAINVREFRLQVLELLVKLYRSSLSKPNYTKIISMLLYLGDAAAVGSVVISLMRGAPDDRLLAYQLCFEISDASSVQLLESILRALPDDVSVAKDRNNESQRLGMILNGNMASELDVKFLYTLNQTDKTILENIKNLPDQRRSIMHAALVYAHAMAQAGTTDDSFLRDNIEWMKRATDWQKFSATAALGVIHKRHHNNAKNVLEPYMPGHANDSHAEGGALYALGLASAGTCRDRDLFTAQFASGNTQEPFLHGLCLGAGLMFLGSHDKAFYGSIRDILYTDTSNAGEAAGLALGAIMMGSSDADAIQEMLAYAKETEHEKIIRSLAVGMSFVFCGLEEKADTMVDQLLSEKDPILRMGATYLLGMAYVGTGNNDATRKLLHSAVSDVSDDVRRSAVINIGFVLVGHPEVLVNMVRLLSESYNPHVRYGATMAVGIACAASGYVDAINLLEPMCNDPVDFVRQGSYIGLALVLQNAGKVEFPATAKLRAALNTCMMSKHDDAMAKLGAVMAIGILDCGGRNQIVSLTTQQGHIRQGAVFGTAVFSLYWFWHPFMYCLSMALKSTILVPLDYNCKVPVLTTTCNAPKSKFDYPEKTKDKVEKKVDDVKNILSVAARRNRRGIMGRVAAAGLEQLSKSETKKKEEPKEQKPEIPQAPADEPQTHELTLPCRVTPRQSKYLDLASITPPGAVPQGCMMVNVSNATEYAYGNESVAAPAPTMAQPPSEFDLPD